MCLQKNEPYNPNIKSKDISTKLSFEKAEDKHIDAMFNLMTIRNPNLDKELLYQKVVKEISIYNATITAYPNPVIDLLNFKINESNLSGELEYYIHSVSGKEMFHKTIPATAEFSIGVDRLDPGMHSIIVFLNGNKILTHQFIVTKL